MLGIVLCGGQSLRMGTDKGLLRYQDKLWAILAEDKLRSIGLDVKFSINPHQQGKYINYFQEAQLIIDDPSLDLNGPLLGVLSAHLENPDKNLFLLACDMLLMESSMLGKLKEVMTADDSFDAYAYTRDGQQEPLCGIYTSTGLKKILNLLQTGELIRHSMKFMLSSLKVCEISVANQDYRSFENFNSHAEINGL